MANYYLQYSVETEALTTQECHFIENIINCLNDPEQWQPTADHLAEAEPITDTAKIAAGIDACCFGYEIEYMMRLGKGDDDHVIEFYADEMGCPYFVGGLMGKMFAKYRPTGQDIFTLEWAEYCSKTALNEFAGGALVASRLGVVMKHTSEMLNELAGPILKELCS